MTTTTWNYQPNAVRIDEFGAFPCLLDTKQRWNGWQCPIFPLDSVKAIALTLDQAEDKTDNDFITFDDDGIWIHNPNYADEYEDPRGDRASEVIVNGETYYIIDSGWCWEETEVDCAECGELFPYSEIVDLTRVGFDPTFVWVCEGCNSVPVVCAGQTPYGEQTCDQIATVLVDEDAEFGMVPTWANVIPQCDSCASNAHRGGFPHAKPIAESNG